MLPLLKSNRLLVVVMVFLFATGIAVPLLMKQMPWQLRFVASFTDLVTATSIALLLRQRRLTNAVASRRSASGPPTS